MMVEVRHRRDRRVPRLKVALASFEERKREEMQEFREWTKTRPRPGIFQQILTIRLG